MLFVAFFAGAMLAIVQGSFFEWAFHRYWLHRPLGPRAFFVAHALIHHQLCKFEDTYQITDEEQREAMTFTWWSGPALIALNLLPWVVISLGLSALGVSLPYVAFLVGFGVATTLYYLGYEGLHYLMHNPRIPWVERSWFFRFINQHHKLHHVRMDRNLNVLVPLADLVMGTFISDAVVPATTPPTAREKARQYSNYGKRLREKQAEDGTHLGVPVA
jgi:hypothetical protein